MVHEIRLRKQRGNSKYDYILNYGAGVNSTALLILLANGGLADMDPRKLLVLFADTGAERPPTYEYVNLIRGYCLQKGISFETVRAQYTLEEYVCYSGILPSRFIRWCTQRLKIRPIRRRAGMHDVAKPYQQLIGFSADESTRARQENLYENAVERFPLIEWGFTRKDCMLIIKGEKLAVPEKSSCFCCPFQRLSSFVLLAKRYPELAKRATKLEMLANLKRNGNTEGAFYLFREPVSSLLERADAIIDRAKRRGTLDVSDAEAPETP